LCTGKGCGRALVQQRVDPRRIWQLPAGSNTQVQLPFTGLTSPDSMAVDNDGSVYVADNNRVLKLPAK
jgi:serine/threonine protein kinase, bacterial